MPYDVYIHRTFDYQLSPTSSSVIDWAPERRMVRAVLNGSGAPAPLWSDSQPGVATWEEPLSSFESRYKRLLAQQQQAQHSSLAAAGPLASADPSVPADVVASMGAGGGGAPVLSSAPAIGGAGPMASGEAPYVGATERVTPENDVFRLYPMSASPSPQAPHTTTGAGGIAPAAVSSAAAAAAGGGPASSLAAAETSATGASGGTSMGTDAYNVYGAATNGAKHAMYATPSSSSPVGHSPLQTHSSGWGNGSTAGPSWWPGWVSRGWLRAPSSSSWTASPGLLPPSPQTVSRDSVWHSYGRVPIYQGENLVVAAALYAGVGLNTTRVWQLTSNAAPKKAAGEVQSATATGNRGPNSDLEDSIIAYLHHSSAAASVAVGSGAGGRHRKNGASVSSSVPASPATAAALAAAHQIPIHTTEKGTSVVEVGSVAESRALRVLNVLQLEWYNAQREWRGVFNLRVLPPTLHTRVPICEYVMQTPWTEWALQSDELVIKWNGFVTLYQQRRPPTITSITRDKEATQATTVTRVPSKAESKGDTNEKKRKAPAVPAAATQSTTTTTPAHSPKAASTAASGAPMSAARDTAKGPKDGKKVATDTATPAEVTAPSAGQGVADSARGAATTTATRTTTASPAVKGELVSSTPASSPDARAAAVVRTRAVPWWRLRELKVGAGVAVKNDLASGINLYWGGSARTGNGLTFSSHVDVLRRMCCACSSSSGAMEASVRLRLNLITFHKTGLDAGVRYRPLYHTHPNTAVRVACSNDKYIVGLQLHDITHEWLDFLLPRPHDAAGPVGGLAEAAGAAGQTVTSGSVSPAERSWWGAVKGALHIGHEEPNAASTPQKDGSRTASPAAGVKASGSPAQKVSPQDPSAAAAAAASSASAEGSWISAGWASATWGYVTHHVGALFGGGQSGPKPGTEAPMTRGENTNSGSPAATKTGPSASQVGKNIANNNSHTNAALPTPGASVNACRRALHRGGSWVHGQASAVSTHSASAYQHAARWTGTAWAAVRGAQARYVTPLLDSSSVDISVGVTCDRRQPTARNWSSFIMISVH